jgi:hypothetical protein
MNNFFENHFNEIKLITNRSKKESRKTISRLQKASEYSLELFNNKIIHNQIKIIEGINIDQITYDGKVLYASSDRIYLPDVATRLYQNLDSILKSYKSHKIHKNDHDFEHPNEDESDIQFSDLADWENDFIKEQFFDFFNSLSDNVKEIFNIKFEIEGQFSIWNIFSPENTVIEFDEFYLHYKFTLFEKETSKKIYSNVYKVPNNEIRIKNIDFSKAREEINNLGNFYKNKVGKIYSVENIYLDNSVIKNLIIKNKLRNTTNSLSDAYDSLLVNEIYDRYGNKNTDSVEDGFIPRQNKIHGNVYHIPRNIIFNGKNSTNELSSFDFIQELVNKKEKFLYIFTDEFLNEHNLNLINPTIAIYHDGKEISLAELDFLEIDDIENIEFSDIQVKNIMFYDNESRLPVGLHLPLFGRISKKSINFI